MSAPLACALLVLAGCFSETYRYVDVTDSADTMRRRLEERGRERDMPVTHDGDKTTLWRKPPEGALPADLPARPECAPRRDEDVVRVRE